MGEFGILEALFMEAFITIHMTIFVFLPLSYILDKNKEKKIFKKLFITRILILLFFDFFITTNIAMFDFFMVFIGAFILVPILTIFKRKSDFSKSYENYQDTYEEVYDAFSHDIDNEIETENNNCLKLKHYINDENNTINELSKFVNRNPKNTVTVTKKIAILSSPNEPTKSIAITSKGKDFEKITVTKDSFNIDTIESPIKYK